MIFNRTKFLVMRTLPYGKSRNSHKGARAEKDKAVTLTLISECLRMVEIHPAAMTTLIETFWRAAFAFVVRNIIGCGISLWNDECVVDHNVLGADVLCSVDPAVDLFKGLSGGERFFFTAASVLDGQRAAFYNIKSLSGMIMPLECLSGRYRKRSYGHSRGPVKEL